MNRRKWALPINIIIFNLSRLIPFRNKRLWIYGAREGDKYDDNSKYMFEYMNEKYSDEIRSVWFTDNDDTFNLLCDKGYEVYFNSSWKGKLIQMRAGVALYCHGLMDFGSIPLVGGTELVALWHGLGFKRIYNGKYSGIKLGLKKFLDRFFSWTYRTLTPVTSEYAKEWSNRMFTLRYNEIKITGQPRNDAFKSLSRKNILNSINISTHKNVIIYMPTYRMASLGKNAIKNIVVDLYNNKSLDRILTRTNSVFLVKLHPLTPHIELPVRENFIIFDYAAVESNHELMGVCDMLVTDCSSCFVDYALLNRPIIFYTPDEKDFLTNSEKMERDFFTISALNKAVTPEELAGKIENPSLDVVKVTNDFFEDQSIKGTCYSENVYRVISNKIGLNKYTK